MTELLEGVLRHGTNTTSFQTLEPGYRRFERTGIVAYVDTGLAWVAAGEPFSAHAERVHDALAFCQAARRARRVSCLFATEKAFADAARVLGFKSILVGEQPVFDPSLWPATLSKRGSLREQLRRARAKGVRVRRVNVEDLVATASLRHGVERLLDRFVASRRMAPMGFVVQLDPFRHAARKVAFVAERDGDVIAYLGVVPIPGRNGWFLEDLIRDRRAPNGTSELLVDAAMRAAVDDGISHATLGLAPLSGPVPRALARVRDITRFLYDFRGLRRFKEKLGPVAFEPVFITYPPWHSAFAATLASLHAFANGSFVRFGARSLGRQPRLLAALVVFALVLCAVLVASFAS